METDPEIIAANLETADKSLEINKPGKEVPREKLQGGFRTYASDIADMMKREKGSIIKIALAEQERRDQYQKKVDPTTTKNIVVMMLGIMLIVGGIMIFIFSIINKSRPVDVVQNNTTLPSFFFTENQAQIDTTDMNRTELINAIHADIADEKLTTGSITNLYVSVRTANGQAELSAITFLQKLGINIPNNFFQNLYPTFMLGIYGREGDNEPFLIFRVKDFNDTFLAMREWEATMLSEFIRLFDIDTSAYGKVIFSKDFETATLFNKEARLLKDSTGKILLSYIFLDPKTVMITTSGDSAEEIIKRLNLQTIK